MPNFCSLFRHMDPEGAASGVPNDEPPGDATIHAAIAPLDLAAGIATVIEPEIEHTVVASETPVDEAVKEEEF